MPVPVDFEIPSECPRCGCKFLGHVNAVDLCGVYFVYCACRTVSVSCGWCLVLEFEGYRNVFK